MIENFKKDYEVCTCAHVTLGEITMFIKKNKIDKLGPIQEFLKIGAGCKYCVCEDADFGKVKKKIYCNNILKAMI